MLSDEENSAVLNLVRNTRGNKASVITPISVKKVGAETKSQPSFYLAADLLREHTEKKQLGPRGKVDHSKTI